MRTVDDKGPMAPDEERAEGGRPGCLAAFGAGLSIAGVVAMVQGCLVCGGDVGSAWGLLGLMVCLVGLLMFAGARWAGRA